MSTPSRIILKLRKEDIGKKVKFDASKLPVPLKEWVETDMDGKVWLDDRGENLCEEVTLTGPYIGIYCHWDGYLDTMGVELRKNYSDYDTALNLIVGGFCSGISCGHVKHYANRKSELVGGWKGIKPVQGSLEEIREHVYGQYEYILNRKWKGEKAY